MKNFWGQEISIGSVVGVGFRRSGAKWHQLGVVVDIQEKSIEYRTETYWQASVVWVSSERGDLRWFSGPIFRSAWPARDLLVIEEDTIDDELLGKLSDAYADVMLKREPSDFVADAL